MRHEHAIGLISRNLLSDFIVTGYIIKQSKSEEEFISNLYRLHSTDLKAVDKMLEMYKKEDLLTEGQHQIYLGKSNALNTIYHAIRNYDKENKLKQFPQIKQIIEMFAKIGSTDAWAKEIVNSYDTWGFYSKYEHLGWYSHELTRRTDKNKSEQRLNNVLRRTLIVVGSCLEILKEQESLNKSLDLYKHFKIGSEKEQKA